MKEEIEKILKEVDEFCSKYNVIVSIENICEERDITGKILGQKSIYKIQS